MIAYSSHYRLYLSLLYSFIITIIIIIIVNTFSFSMHTQICIYIVLLFLFVNNFILVCSLSSLFNFIIKFRFCLRLLNKQEYILGPPAYCQFCQKVAPNWWSKNKARFKKSFRKLKKYYLHLYIVYWYLKAN